MRFMYLTFTLLLCLVACDSGPKDTPARDTATPAERHDANEPIVDKALHLPELKSLWQDGEQVLAKVVPAADAFKSALNAMLANPTLESLSTAQLAWRHLAEQYEFFYVYTRLGIFDTNSPKMILRHHFRVAAWPIEPGFLDGFGPYPFSGLVHDVGIPLNTETLRGQHGMTDNSDVSLGLYAIEFLLFGEQNLRGHLSLRPITGLSEEDQKRGFSTLEELPRNRRRTLLSLQAELLAEDVRAFLDFWQQADQSGHLNQLRFSHAMQKNAIAPHIVRITIFEHAKALEERHNAAITDPKVRFWRDTQLATRLKTQTLGMVALNKQSKQTNTESVTKALSALATTYDNIAKMPPAPNAAADWQPAVTAMKNLVDAMDKSEEKSVTPTES